MQAYKSNDTAPLILYLSNEMVVRGQCHVLATIPMGKEPLLPTQ